MFPPPLLVIHLPNTCSPSPRAHLRPNHPANHSPPNQNLGFVHPRGQLTKEEARKKGSIASRLYKAYFKSAGGLTFTFLWFGLGFGVQGMYYVQVSRTRSES